MSEQPRVATVETGNGAIVDPLGPRDSIGERLSKSGKRIGRPPGSKTSKPSISAGVASMGTGPVDSKREDCSGFVEMAMLVFVSGDEFLKRAIVTKVRLTIKDDTRFREFELEVFNRYVVTEADKAYLRNVLVALALKYPILRKVGPEISLLVFLVRYGAQHIQLLKAVDRLKAPAPKAEPKPA